MAKNLNEKQKKFLSVLYEEANGDIRLAMDLAGYSKETRMHEVTVPLAKEIKDQTRRYLEDGTVLAAKELMYILKNPHEPGHKDRLNAVKELLDRGGFDKTQKIEVESPNAVFILPEKKEDES